MALLSAPMETATETDRPELFTTGTLDPSSNQRGFNVCVGLSANDGELAKRATDHARQQRRSMPCAARHAHPTG